MGLVSGANEPEAKEGKEHVKVVTEFAALLPRRDFTWVGLSSEIVYATVQPVTVTIDMEFFQISELIKRMVLQIVGHNLILLCGLGLILETISSHDSGRLKGDLVCGVIARKIAGEGS